MARANARQTGFASQLDFEVGNSGRLRFDEAVFNMVISTGMLHSLKNPVNVLKEIKRLLKQGSEAWIYDPANVIQFIDRKKWKASLNTRERFFLGVFGLLGLHKPITVYRKSDVIPFIEAAGFEKYEIKEGAGEIRIKLTK
jgi:SAM-dependent methyltransferase